MYEYSLLSLAMFSEITLEDCTYMYLFKKSIPGEFHILLSKKTESKSSTLKEGISADLANFQCKIYMIKAHNAHLEKLVITNKDSYI